MPIPGSIQLHVGGIAPPSQACNKNLYEVDSIRLRFVPASARARLLFDPWLLERRTSPAESYADTCTRRVGL
jgi:hypothetical protein